MSVSLETVREFVGASSSDDSALREDLGQAVELLRGYVRHLRALDEDGTVTGKVDATYDPETDTYAWTDSRELAESDLAGPVPPPVLDRATLEVASDLFTRRNAPGGIINQQFAGPDGASSGPARLHRDPLTPAYPLLGRWVVPF